MYLKSYKELIVWQKSMKLVKEVFLIKDFQRINGLLEEVAKMLNYMTSKMRELEAKR